MAVCGNCGATGPRVRTLINQAGMRDECPACAPQSFEKLSNPSDKKIWMGYEAHPNEYVKSIDGGFDRKPEYRAEQEAQLAQGPTDEIEAQRLAEERKRAERRTRPMDATETLHAISRARMYAEALEAAAAEAEAQTRQAELDSWIAKSSQA